MDFKLEHEMVGDELILYPIGELDIYTTPEFREKSLKFYDENKRNILVDCEKLEYLDSTGLGAFIFLLKHVKEDGHRIYIRHLRDSIKKLFTITKLDGLFEIRGE